MDPFSQFMTLVVVAYAGNYYLQWWLATKHPNAYESLKRVEAERRRGMADAAAKSAQVGFSLYKFLRSR